MWSGINTPELINLKEKYWELFGYNPDYEEELEFGTDLPKYINVLSRCIKEKKQITDYYPIDEDDYC